MNVISKRGLLQLASRHTDSLGPLLAWFQVARRAVWEGLQDVREDFPTAEQVGNVLIFDIRGNRYRLVTRVNYAGRRIFVKDLLAHAEYDRRRWMKWV